ncbi:hypothetical protein L6R52_09835 [Myxococcota bacterium]|nr:hypothetical protein [Myxococcota bacterium]
MKRLVLSLLALSPTLACSSTDGTTFTPKPTVAEVGADPLAGTGVTSCPIYQDEQCVAGRKQRCDIYDAAAKSFVASPDPLLHRVFLYDRWYDKFSSPVGLTGERLFDGPMPGATPESEWSSPARFAGWAGMGDAGIWTGAALVSDTFRYVATRTEADYLRMEEKTRTLVRSFEVTGIPGYLSRFHFLAVPEGTPQNDQLVLEVGRERRPVHLEIADLDLPGLPSEYRTGVDDGQGGKVVGTAYWDGDVSIDQYTGPMTAFPIVYNLLKDEALKEKIVHHLTCYLKRLQRIEVRNLKARPELIEELRSLFGGTDLMLDADDPDIAELNEMVWFVHRGINTTNEATFDRSCPAGLPYEAGRVLDARSPTFESELLELATDINRSIRNRPNQIDHFYIVSLRGGDASHLMHLAAMAYYFTGDEQYRTFLFDELIGKLRTNDVARTMMAFRLPDWCFRFYGDHITYGTHWQFVTMLPDGDLKDEMIRVMHEEAWEKALHDHESAKFNTMYASIVKDRPERETAIASVVRQLGLFGGNDGVQDAPRRTHNHTRDEIIAAMPADITVRCPTAAERNACEDGGTIFGFPLESSIISYECDGRAGECVMDDGKCVQGLASSGLPANLRIYADFLWQRSPFQIGEDHGVDGQKQSPGRDLGEPYWLARHYGFIDEGRDQVLAWNDVGACE